MISAEWVVAEAKRREEAGGPVSKAARQIMSAYDGTMVVPVPEGLTAPAVANLIRQGVDHVGMRVADPFESITVPANKPGERAERKAEAQRRAGIGLLEAARYRLGKRERARHLVGYGRSPIHVRPDFDTMRPTFECYEPLNVLPSPGKRGAGDLVPRDAIICSTQTWQWLCEHYPDQAAGIYKGFRWESMSPPQKASTRFRVYRYECADECMLVLGTQADRPQEDGTGEMAVSGHCAVLEHYENPAGTPTIVVPDIITLTSTGTSVFDQMLGMYQGRAELQALSIEAVRRGVFQEEWLEARQNERPEVIAVPDPVDGTIGVVQGGVIRPRPVDPQFMQNQALDRMEYAERQTGGIPPEFGGSASSNVRTGRRGGQILSSTVDFPVAEAQELLAASLEHELEIAAKVDRAWFAGHKRIWHVGWKGAKGRLDYDPAEMWATLPTFRVSHVSPGQDVADMIVTNGQRIGMGTMSKTKFMEQDPAIDDVKAEHDRIVLEQVEAAALSSVQAMAANPEGPWQPVDFAMFHRLIDLDGVTIYEAIEQVNAAAQERQSQQVQPGSPEAMPGLSMPGQGAEAGAMAIPDPTQSQPSSGNLNELLLGLVGTQRLGGVR